MKKIIKIKLKKVVDNSYPVLIGLGMRKKLPAIIKTIGGGRRTVVVTDNLVKKLWGAKIVAGLRLAGHKIDLLDFPAGEKSKIQATVGRLQSEMFKRGCGRNTLLIALGGGVVGDVTGFAAATYMRGLPYIQVPTTLLAMVDSSSGGKTGIDTPQGKNLIGAFWQPKAVLVDVDFLQTLPRRQVVNGLAEAIKIFLTSDAKMFALLEENLEKILAGDKNMLGKIIYRSLQLKTSVVERDERESGERMILNFGHTIGHALEKLSGYKLLHGEAVALGMVTESGIANRLGLLAPAIYERVQNIIGKLGINIGMLKKYNSQEIINTMRTDKKGSNNFVLLKDIGAVYVKNKKYAHMVDDTIIKKILN